MLFAPTVFVRYQKLCETWWSKIKDFQFLWTTNIQKLPEAENTGASVETY